MCPNIINFDSVEFSERRPEEVISFFDAQCITDNSTSIYARDCRFCGPAGQKKEKAVQIISLSVSTTTQKNEFPEMNSEIYLNFLKLKTSTVCVLDARESSQFAQHKRPV